MSDTHTRAAAWTNQVAPPHAFDALADGSTWEHPAPTPPTSEEVRNASNAAHAEYLRELAEPRQAMWHSPADRMRLAHIAERLVELDEAAGRADEVRADLHTARRDAERLRTALDESRDECRRLHNLRDKLAPWCETGADCEDLATWSIRILAPHEGYEPGEVVYACTQHMARAAEGLATDLAELGTQDGSLTFDRVVR